MRKTLSLHWPKLTALSCFVVFLIFGIGFLTYTSNRHISTESSKKQISTRIMGKIDTMVQGNPNIVAIQIASVNLPSNTRYNIYSVIRDSNLNHLYSVLTNSRVMDATPIFTEDDANNTRMTKVVNHEFICTPFKETVNYRSMPLAAEYVATVCDVSIPPSYGHFSGVIEIFLKVPPTELEKDVIRTTGRDLSANIFAELI